MPYLYPGTVAAGDVKIQGSTLSKTLFMGVTNRGPIGFTPVSSQVDYQNQFGGIHDFGDDPHGDILGHSVNAFFTNGGRCAAIVRLDNGASTAEGDWKHSGETDGFRFFAINSGAWGNHITVQFTLVEGSNELYDLEVGKLLKGDWVVEESYADISLDPVSSAYLATQINENSLRLRVTTQSNVDATRVNGLEGEGTVTLLGGDNGSALISGSNPAGNDPVWGSYSGVFDFLRNSVQLAGESLQREESLQQDSESFDINIICLPGQYWPETGGNSIIEAAIAHAEQVRNRMVIVDPEPHVELLSKSQVNTMALPSSSYGAFYYPWVGVNNPYYHAETNPALPATLLIPPSGFAAGIWAKTSSRRGVWQGPAGLESQLQGVVNLAYSLDNDQRDLLNALAVNTLSGFKSATLIWGAHTLASNTEAQWAPIAVRRTAMLIEDSLYKSMQWLLFRPNNGTLWSTVRTQLDAFMDLLFRSGAFKGSTAREAYFVRCGLGDTMTQDNVARGEVIVQLGFAAFKAAEFVGVHMQASTANNIVAGSALAQAQSIVLSNSNIDEGTDTTGGVVIGELSAFDSGTATPVSFAIVGGADQGKFSLAGPNSDQLVLDDGTLDYEAQFRYHVMLEMTDALALSSQQILSIEINNLPEPVIDSYTGTPELVALGEDFTLSWTTSHADTVSIDNGIGSVPIDGSIVVTATGTTTYTLTASGLKPDSVASSQITLQPSLVLWLDASVASTVIDVLGSVTQWSDNSDLAGHLIQNTSANQPTTGIASENGLNLISFDGVNDYLGTDSLTFDPSSPHTIFCLLKAPNLGSDVSFLSFNTSAGEIAEQFILKSSREIKVEHQATGEQELADSSGWTDNTFTLLSIFADGASMRLYINGALQKTVAVSLAAADEIRVGARVKSGSEEMFFEGDIGEIAIYNRELTETERLLQEGLLFSKWGIVP
ncbi:MAG: LamG-like jellyroll fold domain-containing protein [Pseudomonadales bacterium]